MKRYSGELEEDIPLLLGKDDVNIDTNKYLDYDREIESSDLNDEELNVADKSKYSISDTPYLDPRYWSPDQIPEIQKYVIWHRKHPHCHTPRPLNSEDILQSKKIRFMYDEEDENLVYFHVHGYEESVLPDEFKPSTIGLDCDTNTVSVIATKMHEKKHASKHKYNNPRYEDFDFYDPIYNRETWYSLSVQDQLVANHSNDNSSISRLTKASNGSIYDYSIANAHHETKEDIDFNTKLLLKSSKKKKVDVSVKFAGYQGGSPWIQDDITQALTALSKGDKLDTIKTTNHIRKKNVKVNNVQNTFNPSFADNAVDAAKDRNTAADDHDDDKHAFYSDADIIIKKNRYLKNGHALQDYYDTMRHRRIEEALSLYKKEEMEAIWNSSEFLEVDDDDIADRSHELGFDRPDDATNQNKSNISKKNSDKMNALEPSGRRMSLKYFLSHLNENIVFPFDEEETLAQSHDPKQVKARGSIDKNRRKSSITLSTISATDPFKGRLALRKSAPRRTSTASHRDKETISDHNTVITGDLKTSTNENTSSISNLSMVERLHRLISGRWPLSRGMSKDTATISSDDQSYKSAASDDKSNPLGISDTQLSFQSSSSRQRLNYAMMIRRLGGRKNIESISNGFINYSVRLNNHFAFWGRIQMTYKGKLKKNPSNGGTNGKKEDNHDKEQLAILFDACEKLHIALVKSFLSSNGYENDMLFNNDVPPLYYMFEKALKMDQVTGTTMLDAIPIETMNTSSDLNSEINRKNSANTVQSSNNGKRSSLASATHRDHSASSQQTKQASLDRIKIDKILNLFIEYKANVDRVSLSTGYAPIHLAAFYGNSKMAKWCVDHGSNVNITAGDAQEHMTPILIAAKYSHIETIVDIYNLGGRLEEKDRDGNTILHIAAASGSYATTIFLLRIGLDKTILNKAQQSPSDVAVEMKYYNIAQLLLSFRLPHLSKADILHFYGQKQDLIYKQRRETALARIAAVKNQIQANISADSAEAVPNRAMMDTKRPSTHIKRAVSSQIGDSGSKSISKRLSHFNFSQIWPALQIMSDIGIRKR